MFCTTMHNANVRNRFSLQLFYSERVAERRSTMPPYKSPSFCPTSFDLICMSKRKKSLFLPERQIHIGRAIEKTEAAAAAESSLARMMRRMNTCTRIESLHRTEENPPQSHFAVGMELRGGGGGGRRERGGGGSVSVGHPPQTHLGKGGREGILTSGGHTACTAASVLPTV